MLIDFFHKLYNDTYKLAWPCLHKIKFPATLRLLIRHIVNLVVPLAFKLQRNNSQFSLANQRAAHTNFTVSLTSFPQRIAKVHLVIESILRQTCLPSHIILWLSKEQFNSIESLPKNLLQLRSRGLTIKLTEGDLRSFKKYYYLLKDQPDAKFIIVDDDIFYPSNLLQNLLNSHRRYPNAVCANRCYLISPDKKYFEWTLLDDGESGPRDDLLPTGCGGVLYPANSLHKDALDQNLFIKLSLDADDIWLSCCAYLNKTKFVCTGNNEYFLPIMSKNNIYLHTTNVENSNNDVRLKSVRDYYRQKENLDVIQRQ